MNPALPTSLSRAAGRAFRGLAIAAVLSLLSGVAAGTHAQESGIVRYLTNYTPPSGGGYTAGCWGWTDTAGGREYALLGNISGTSIVEITDVGNVVERDFVPGATSQWREIMTWSHYAYVVSEGGGGTQIIDLSSLPDSAHLVKAFTYTLPGKSTNRAHTVHTDNGYLYLNGCAQWSPGGIVIFDLADPENPVFTGEYSRTYIHDCFVRNDTIYGAAIYGVGLDIIDATDKTAPGYLYTISYAGAGTHNAATTSDGRYALTTDEIGSTAKTLKIWDLSSPPSFPKVAEYAGSPTAIVHNVFVKDNFAIMSYYTAGIRVVDITDPLHPAELGGYDTRPGDESGSYTGAWSVYPYFPSGKIIVGDMGLGMFVVDMNTAAPRGPSEVRVYSDYSTPGSVSLAWTDPLLTVGGDTLTGSVTIRIYRDGVLIADVPGGAGTFVDTGLTLHQHYSFTLFALSGGDSSAPVTAGVYAGGAAEPLAPSGFDLADLGNGVRLDWINPAAQADGTPLNDLEAIEMYRDGELIAEIPAGSPDTGQVESRTDTILGYHWYMIRARDSEMPAHYSPYSDSILGFGGLLSSYSEDFETGGAWLLKTGSWDTTHALAYTGSGSMTDSPFGDYPNGAQSSFITPRFVVPPASALTFRHIAIMRAADFGWVEITNNRGRSYSTLRGYNSFAHPEWGDLVADPGDWFAESLPLDVYAGDTVALRFELQSDATNNADGWYIDDIAVGPATGVGGGQEGTPGSFRLYQNTPNPFNPSTTIRFDLPTRSAVRLAVYDILGEEIALLLSADVEPGPHAVAWDGRARNGAPAASGVYLCHIDAEGTDGSHHGAEQRMLLIK